MADARFERAVELFLQACDLTPDERTTFLESACDGDNDLRSEVESLLRYDLSNDDAVKAAEAGAGVQALAAGVDAGVSQGFPDRMGRYRIIRKIGEGGMGEVFEAEQESPKRRVALKIVRSGFMTPQLKRRFEHEAYILGQLHHPGIAHIYESGVVNVNGRNQPFFAMELIDGDRINTFAEKGSLSLEQRLELIARCCDAVQHAHQKGIIHRDLKPGNILVVVQDTGSNIKKDDSNSGTVYDPVGQPKILDFGIARMTDGDVLVATIQTEVGQLVGTLAYMSPEQVAGDSTKLDTRCDVYALGVVLFQLLTGRLPHDLTNQSVAEAARIIRDVDPISAASADRSLRGDITTIIGKALEKDPDRRYPTAAELASDLRRVNRDEPILARRATTFYQIRKFSKRHKGLVGGVVMTLIALLAGLGSTLKYLIEAREQRDQAVAARDDADRERDNAVASRKAADVALESSNEVTQFLTDTLSAANPEASGKDVTVRSIIDQAAREIDHRFKERPLIEARVRKSMGLTYLSLGAFDAAEHQLQQAESLWNELPGENTPEALDLQVSRGSIHYYRGEYQQALAVTDDAIERLRISGGSELQLIQARTARAVILMRLGRLDEAKSDLEKSTRYSNHSSGQNARVDAMGILARLYSQLGSDEAESLYQELISDSRRYYGDEHPKTLMLQGNLSAHYRTRGRSDEAIPIVRRVLEAQTRLLGATHRQTLISANNLARALAAVNQTDEALMMVNDAMEKSVAEHGELADTTLFLTTSLGIVLRRSGKLDEAESVLKQSIDLHLSQVGPDAEGTFDAQRMLINLYIARRKGVQAIELATPLMTRLVTLYPDEHPRLSKLRYDIARAYISDRRYRDAERMLLLAHKSIDPHWKGAVRKLLARLYDHLGSTDEAVKWRTAQEDTKD